MDCYWTQGIQLGKAWGTGAMGAPMAISEHFA